MKELFLLLVSLGNILHIKIIESNDTEYSPKGVSQMNYLVSSVKNSSLNTTSSIITVLSYISKIELKLAPLDINYDEKYTIIDFQNDLLNSKKIIIKRLILNFENKNVFFISKAEELTFQSCELGGVKYLSDYDYYSDIFRSCKKNYISNCTYKYYPFTSVEYGIFNRIPNLKNLCFRSFLLNLNLHLIFGAIYPDSIIDGIYICDSEISGEDIKYISTLKVKVLILIHTKNTLSEVSNNLCDDVIKQTSDGLKI
ncbi:hypothetical protein CWI36_1363p0020 [Hamiltosporidium magnivora]|uniref:Uncharacterized protein n=1 Tax=Hamiltosporidium magnivora TaxID=148818 RepID=A0A4Q9L1U6_9MICR|nr:hypothetical protein CWI36_1363p0020 [Hamiltosporidium magnivora]